MQLLAAGDLTTMAGDITGYASQNPVTVAAVVVALLVLVGGSVALYRYLTRSPVSKLRGTLAEYDAVTVLMHPDPDPDAMASALAVDQLAADAGTETTLCYSGEIRRPGSHGADCGRPTRRRRCRVRPVARRV